MAYGRHAFCHTVALAVTAAIFLSMTVDSAAVPQYRPRSEKRGISSQVDSHHGHTHLPHDAPHNDHFHTHVHNVGRPSVGGGHHGHLALTAGGGLNPYGGGLVYSGIGLGSGLHGIYGAYPSYGLGGGLGGLGGGLGGLGGGLGGIGGGLGGYGLSGYGLSGYGLPHHGLAGHGLAATGLGGAGLGAAGIGGAGHYGGGVGLNGNHGLTYGW